MTLQGVPGFSIKVWITTVIITPLMVWVSTLISDHRNFNGDYVDVAVFCGYSSLVLFIFTIPALIIFYLSAKIISKQHWPLIRKKALLILIGVLFGVVILLIVALIANGRENLRVFEVMIPYTLVVIATISIFRLNFTK